MSYLVLARKWRPMSFADLIGQEHVSRTLLNAIEQNRVAHAFLFTGVRGVGKTTSARILAKALNCLAPGTGAGQSSVEPCLKCAACVEIAEGTDIDVREIDGASYNGVDEIRKLQDSLPYRPARDRFKIIIVDEVHMLSQNAWNALLKTLEEPPPHVKFILATTEVNKVPVTILSRVQRFDFKMIPGRLIAERVRHVLTAEGIEADDPAVALIAREAQGSMRDALSLLDQVIAFSPGRLRAEDTARVLGVAGYSTLHRIGAAVIEGNAAEALSWVARLADQSCEPAIVARDLLALFRDLVVARLGPDTDGLLDLPEDEKREVLELAGRAEPNDLLRLQQGFAKAFDDISRAAQPRAALEMLLVRLSLRPALIPIDELIARLARLEGRLSQSGGPPAPGSGSPPRRSEGAPKGPGAGRGSPGLRATGADAGEPSAPRPQPEALRPPPEAPRVEAERPAPRMEAERPAPRMEAERPAPRTTGEAAAPRMAPDATPPRMAGNASNGKQQPAAPSLPTPPVMRPPVARPANGSPTAAAAPAPVINAAAAAPSVNTLSQPLRDWRTVLTCLGESRPDIMSFLQHASPKRIDAEQIVVGYAPGNALEAMARSEESVKALRDAATRVFGKAPSIGFEVAEAGAATLAEADKRVREEQRVAAIDRAHHHPSVQSAVEILGARIKQVQILEG